MNLLVDDLPTAVCGTPIRTDYRYMVLLEQLLKDPEMSGTEKIGAALDLLYIRRPAASLKEAWDGLLWFYRCGESNEYRQDSAPQRSDRPVYDFDQDAAYIYAAFRQVYGIDLQAGPLHWWAFRALLSSLPDSCLMGRIMGWRATDTRKLKGSEKRHVEKMQRLFAIKGHGAGHALTLAEQEAAYKAWVDERFRAAEEWMAQKPVK